MATSTIPALKANLLAQLQARGGLAGVQVSYGPPLPAPQDKFIWLGDVEADQEYAAMAAPNQRKETYELSVVVWVERQGTDTKSADEACFALLAEVEAQLRSDPTVNGAVTEAHLGTYKLSELVADTTRMAQLEARVNCQAWI